MWYIIRIASNINKYAHNSWNLAPQGSYKVWQICVGCIVASSYYCRVVRCYQPVDHYLVKLHVQYRLKRRHFFLIFKVKYFYVSFLVMSIFALPGKLLLDNKCDIQDVFELAWCKHNTWFLQVKLSMVWIKAT